MFEWQTAFDIISLLFPRGWLAQCVIFFWWLSRATTTAATTCSIDRPVHRSDCSTLRRQFQSYPRPYAAEAHPIEGNSQGSPR